VGVSLQRRVLAGLATLIASTSLFVPAAGARQASKWYWTPGLCKAKLQNYGVKIGDGRTYNVAKAYCVGLHNHCWLSGGVRRYKVFTAVMLSYDGVVRRLQLTVTGRTTWSGTQPVIIDRHMSSVQFELAYGPAAWIVAKSENAAGCWDLHP